MKPSLKRYYSEKKKDMKDTGGRTGNDSKSTREYQSQVLFACSQPKLIQAPFSSHNKIIP